MLLADDDKQPRVSLGEAEKCLVVSECREDERDVIESAVERAMELVHEELRLARVGRAHDERVEEDVTGVHL